MRNNEGKAVENRREDKRAFGKFIAIMIACVLGGGIVGFTMAWIDADTWQTGVAEAVRACLRVISPWAGIVLSSLLLAAAGFVMRKSRRSFHRWDGENEEDINRIEEALSIVIIGCNVNLLLSYFFMGAGLYVIDWERLPEMYEKATLALLLVGTIYAMAVTMILQKNIVNFEKEINPEKQGSVYETGFQKKWLESCDEAERFQIYKCAYKSYITVNGLCVACWLISVLGILFWDFGILPMVFVMIIWLGSSISYSIESMRLSKRSEKML